MFAVDLRHRYLEIFWR